MKIDLHLHSRASKRPTQWVLQKIGAPESFSEPKNLYRLTQKMGMDAMTLTDHNTIEGCLSIAHFSGVFISEEVTSYFPEDGCKVHILVHDITENIHKDIKHLRKNIYELVQYLKKSDLHYAIAHPLFSINRKLTIEHFEKLILLFKVFELNGARDEGQNQLLKKILQSLNQETIDRLANKHNLEPLCVRAWEKALIGGSDDHSSLNIARMHTFAPHAKTLDEFFLDINLGRAKVLGQGSTARTMAHNLYGIAYQFFHNRFNLEKYIGKDVLMCFLDQSLRPCGNSTANHLILKVMSLLHKHRAKNLNDCLGLQDVLKQESRNLIMEDPDLCEIVKKGTKTCQTSQEDLWFNFVSRLTDKVVKHLSERLADHVSGKNLFSLFETIGAAGSNYMLLAPYFVAFGLFSRDKHLANELKNRFLKAPSYIVTSPKKRIKVALFTDTFMEINGVAHTLRQQAKIAEKTGKNLTILTCLDETPQKFGKVRNFSPIATYDLPEYQEQKITLPPFLEVLDHIQQNGYTYIHSATPGPMGLLALACAKVLDLPVSATYHTAFPQYANYLTGDQNIEELMWRYVIWYYDQMDSIYVPSQNTCAELIKKGIKQEKIRTYPRGVDTKAFNPGLRNGWFQKQFNLKACTKLLYVGRISKEKNLPLLVKAFKKVHQKACDTHLIIVGDGPYLSEMQKELKGMPCTFTGSLKGRKLAMAYASSDLFVFPSTTDTFGNVVLEAQASGLPVIVTDRGGPQENIIHNQSGLIVQKDSAIALANAILSLIQHPNRLKQMSQKARSLMESRSFEQAFARQWNLYSLEKGAAVPCY